MTIRILPPQLANQIAAGEVVERPASVVKELVENSLDAGADQIDIDIDKGGSKLIRVRDNGSGIAEQELVLALSRHATSKITNLTDLEAITSLGFRGEALASISSVSRLTLTSRTAEQDAAWQANAEGRDMQVTVKPAAHPVGTSIEVLDLFFNTPARRKFLRTDKTEFGHIDELIKRLALSRYDVSWQLNHNGQTVRRLKAATTDEQRHKRVAALCGRAFAEQAAFIENQYGEVKIWGWLVHPAACSASLQCQYSYVNGRMMRDKLLNHAIRQAYGDSLTAEQQPAFVLYLELDPHQVDVNVHPAKHEVRFHQARLVHDFVVSALSDALRQLQSAAPPLPAAVAEPAVRQTAAAYQPVSGRGSGYRAGQTAHPGAAAVSRELSYWHSSLDKQQTTEATAAVALPGAQHHTAGPAAALLISDNRYLLTRQREGSGDIIVLDLLATLSHFLPANPQPAVSLLLPQRIRISAALLQLLTDNAGTLSQAGFDLLLTDLTAIVRAVPAWLRQTTLSQWLPLWLAQLEQQPTMEPLNCLVSMLLKDNGLDAYALLECLPDVMRQPEHWRYVPLQLDAAIRQLQECTNEPA
ncbi:DNA mismatch repair endonuclease MutL [Rheinheimera muenzenbergensis]|uniref:DNA mismatch repair protein MutL n=1 Tax=Rheinheimera muenzenbergensis TaxID=1193628 RepID=A0ABU8C539_9GAMM